MVNEPSGSHILHGTKGCCDAKSGADTERREQLVSALVGVAMVYYFVA
jgi:hypothetical protein